MILLVICIKQYIEDFQEVKFDKTDLYQCQSNTGHMFC